MVPHSSARSRLGVLLVLGLCGAVTAGARTSSAGARDVIDARFGASALGGTASRLSDSTTSSGVSAAIRGVDPSGISGNVPGLVPIEALNRHSAWNHVWGPEKKADLGTMRPVWPTSEVVLSVDDSYLALPHAMTALQGALLAWTSRCSWLPKVTIRLAHDRLEGQTAEQNLNDHRIFFSPYGDARARGALAVTLVTADEGNNTIIDADILVNGGHSFTDVTTLGVDQNKTQLYDLQNVLAHEFGHWFGLDENLENPEATMYAFVFPGEQNKRDLADDDVQASELAHLQAQYADAGGVGCAIARTEPKPSRRWIERILVFACMVWFERTRSRRGRRGPSS